MSSLKRHEGYLLIDHRNSPGISEELAHAAGLPSSAGKGLFEAPTYTCSHCQAVVVLNPDRRRDRAYCPKCDHYICDQCGQAYGATRECRPFEQVIEEMQEQSVRNNVLLT